MLGTFFDALIDVLQSDEDTCMALLAAHGVDPDALVDLIVDELSSYEALCYARTLLEIGRDVEAEEVVRAVIAAGYADVPQGSQNPVGDTPQGAQYVN